MGNEISCLTLVPASGGQNDPQSTYASVSPKPWAFCDIIQDSEGYLLPYKVLSHLCRKCGHDGMKPEVRFTKLAKSRMPNGKSHDYKQQTLSSTTFIFSWVSGRNLLLAWFLDVNIHSYLRPRKRVSCLWKFTDILFLLVITISGFERDCDAILVIWRRHVPHDVVSPFTEFMDT